MGFLWGQFVLFLLATLQSKRARYPCAIAYCWYFGVGDVCLETRRLPFVCCAVRLIHLHLMLYGTFTHPLIWGVVIVIAPKLLCIIAKPKTYWVLKNINACNPRVRELSLNCY
jgi:hypothetical protein